MKKVLSVLLAAALLLGVASCGTQPAPVAPTESTPAASSGTSVPMENVGPKNSNPLSDIRVRMAISYAIDKQALIDGLMQGKAQPANVLMPNGDWKAEGLNDYAYDPEKAKALLKEANWDPNYTLDVVYYYGDQMTVDLMAAIQQYLADVGIKMTARKLEGDLASQLWVAPADPVNGPSAVKWDMAYAALAALAPHDYYNRFMTGFAANSYYPSDPAYDALLQATNETADLEKQKAAFKEVEKYENANVVELPLYYQPVFTTQSEKLDRGAAPYGNEQYNYDWAITTWTVKPDESGKSVMRTNGGPVEFFETPFYNPGLFMSTKVLYDHLLVADENLDAKAGQLASEYTVSDDGMTYEFTLRDGIKWHDGEPITAEDVKWTFECATQVAALHAVFNSTISSLEGYQEFKDGTADNISGIVIDGNKLTFQFAKVDPNALLTFTQFAPLPKKYFEGIDPLKIQQAPYFQNPVGSGPYKLKEVKMGNYATFVPFEEYWGGKAKIEEINMYPSGESDPNLVKNAASGVLDYAYTKAIEDVIALEQMPAMKVVAVDNRYTRLLYFNQYPKQ